LYTFSPRAARAYFRAAMRLCAARGISMSMLLHPTDLLDAQDAPALSFFPGMFVPAKEKSAFLRWVISTMQSRFDVVGTGTHIEREVLGERGVAIR
jgi:hypothetical protein